MTDKRKRMLDWLITGLSQSGSEISSESFEQNYDLELTDADRSYIESVAMNEFEYKRDHLSEYFDQAMIDRLTETHLDRLIELMFKDEDIYSVLQSEMDKLNLSKAEYECLQFIVFKSLN